MSAAITFDPSRRVDFYYRPGMDGSKTFTFVDPSGEAYALDDFTFRADIKRRLSDSETVLQLTESSGLTKATNTLAITFTDTQLSNLSGDYFIEIFRTDSDGLIKRWINGYFKQTWVFDGINSTETITIDENGTALTVTISESSPDIEGTAVKSTGETGGSKFLRENGDGTSSWQSIPGGIKQISRTFTASELLHAFSSPIEFIPAPGDGKMIQLILVSAFETYVSTSYDNSHYLGTNDGVNGWQQISDTYAPNTSGHVLKIMRPTTGNISTIQGNNQAVYLYCPDYDPNEGDHIITLDALYRIVDIPVGGY